MQIAEVESLLVAGGQYVRITTDTGLVGIGQSAAWAYPEATGQVVQTARRHLLGKDPLRTEHHWQHLYRMGPFRGSILSGAVSAIDIALWDIKGQQYQAPIWDLLGGSYRDKIRLHLLMGADSPETVAAEARRALDDGFTAIKFDPLPSGYQDLTLDGLVAETVEMVAAAREAVRRDADIILELHRKLSPLQAVPLCEALARFQPLFIEDPLPIDSIVSQAEIARRVSAPIANGERLHNVWEFRELLVSGGSQYVRPDVGLAGGISGCKKIAALAESYHAAVVTHNYLGPVLTAASVHLDAAIPNFVTQEYSRVDEGPMAEAFPGTLRRRGGYLPLPEGPGLGVRIDVEKARALPAHPAFDPTTIPYRQDGSVAYAV